MKGLFLGLIHFVKSFILYCGVLAILLDYNLDRDFTL